MQFLNKISTKGTATSDKRCSFVFSKQVLLETYDLFHSFTPRFYGIILHNDPSFAYIGGYHEQVVLYQRMHARFSFVEHFKLSKLSKFTGAYSIRRTWGRILFV
jgi:hypothetical protein